MSVFPFSGWMRVLTGWTCRQGRRTGGRLLLAGALFVGSSGRLDGAGASEPGEPEEVTLSGRWVCLAEEVHRVHRVQIPSRHEHLHGFRDAAGTLYTLLATRTSEGLFKESRLQSAELKIRARRFPRSNLLELISLRTVRAGIENEVYYYCTICHIYMISPGLCECCQQPSELVEEPVSNREKKTGLKPALSPPFPGSELR